MNRFAKFVVVLGAAAVGATAAAAADDPVKVRKELMKSVGKSTKLAAQMVKGKVAFDGGKAAEAMMTIAAVPDKYVTLFPEGTDMKNNPDSEASPKIWTDMAGFKKAADKLKADSTAAAEAAKKGEADFKAAFGALVKNCKSCHEGYRVKKQQ